MRTTKPQQKTHRALVAARRNQRRPRIVTPDATRLRRCRLCGEYEPTTTLVDGICPEHDEHDAPVTAWLGEAA